DRTGSCLIAGCDNSYWDRGWCCQDASKVELLGCWFAEPSPNLSRKITGEGSDPFPLGKGDNRVWGGIVGFGTGCGDLEPVPASLRKAVRGPSAKRAFARFGQDDGFFGRDSERFSSGLLKTAMTQIAASSRYSSQLRMSAMSDGAYRSQLEGRCSCTKAA